MTQSLREARANADKVAIKNAISECGHNLSATARMLKISRPTLYALIKEHKIFDEVPA